MLTIDFERLGLGPGSRLLDLGCGDGRHSRPTRHLKGVSVVAVDLGEKETETAARSLQELDATDAAAGGSLKDAGPWMVLRASVYGLPFAAASFDCVIISEVLEHLSDDRRALKEIARVLKPGGILALSVPREGPEALCWALSAEYRKTAGGHLRIYRRAKLRKMVREAGCRVTSSHFAHGLHAPFWWLKCLVGPSKKNSLAVRLYHGVLVWDLMRRPRLTAMLNGLLTPFIGKSFVLYAVKE